jgi:hypothetical protein
MLFGFRCRCIRHGSLAAECAPWQGLPADTPLIRNAYFKPPQSYMSKPMNFMRRLIIRPPRGHICSPTRRLQRLPRTKAPAPPPIKDMHVLGLVKPLRRLRALTNPAACKIAPLIGVAGCVVSGFCLAGATNKCEAYRSKNPCLTRQPTYCQRKARFLS